MPYVAPIVMEKVCSIDLNKSNPPELVVTAVTEVLHGSSGELSQVVYVVAPADGIQDFDFNITPPGGMTPQIQGLVSATMSMIKPDWCIGVRIKGDPKVSYPENSTGTGVAELRL